MSILSKILPPKYSQTKQAASYFRTFTEYSPAFSTWRGGIYEQALTRAVVERYALACSKLKPEIIGTSKPRLTRIIHGTPNSYMTWSKFLARCATILDTDTTCAIVPSLDNNLNITGVFPLKFENANILEYDGEPYISFNLASGDTLTIELSRVCLLTRFQYSSDFFGSGNSPLFSTMRLIDAQEQAQELAIKTGANIRFIGRVAGLMDEKKLEEKRNNFSEQNLASTNTSGLILYDQAFQDIKQIDNKNYTISTDELNAIENNVFNYFGMSKNILQNDFSEDEWGAYYESRIEPFAIQLSEGLTQMFFTAIEQTHGNRVMFSSNRLEYASNASKRNMVRDMCDRGIMSINEGREVLQLPPVDGGDIRVIRGEYMDASLIEGIVSTSKIAISKNYDSDSDLGGDDQIYNDTDDRGTKEEDN